MQVMERNSPDRPLECPLDRICLERASVSLGEEVRVRPFLPADLREQRLKHGLQELRIWHCASLVVLGLG